MKNLIIIVLMAGFFQMPLNQQSCGTVQGTFEQALSSWEAIPDPVKVFEGIGEWDESASEWDETLGEWPEDLMEVPDETD